MGKSVIRRGNVCKKNNSAASGKVTQAEARTHGLGRGIAGRRSRSYFLVAKDTIEESLCELLQKRQRIISDTLDGEGQGEHLDLLDQLVQLLQRKP